MCSERLTQVSVSLLIHSIVVLTHLLPDSPSQSSGSDYGGSSRAEGKPLPLVDPKNDLCHLNTGRINRDNGRSLT